MNQSNALRLVRHGRDYASARLAMPPPPAPHSRCCAAWMSGCTSATPLSYGFFRLLGQYN